MPVTDERERICTIRIELCDSKPLIWREVEAPVSITLDDLHDIIQITMGWESEHLFEFTIGKDRFCPPDEFTGWFESSSDSGSVQLSDFLRPRKTTFQYLYDFGDSWEHRLTITKIRAPEAGVSYPRFVGGERSGPPEDCGGLYGFYEGLKWIAQHDADNEDSDEFLWWADDFDPDDVDVEGIEEDLRAMADRLAKRKRGRRKKPRAASLDDVAMTETMQRVVSALRAATPPRPALSRPAGNKSPAKA